MKVKFPIVFRTQDHEKSIRLYSQFQSRINNDIEGWLKDMKKAVKCDSKISSILVASCGFGCLLDYLTTSTCKNTMIGVIGLISHVCTM